MKIHAWANRGEEEPFGFWILPFLGYGSDPYGKSIYIGWLIFTIEIELWSSFGDDRNGD